MNFISAEDGSQLFPLDSFIHFNGIRIGTGPADETLAAHIGCSKGLVFLSIFQKYIITCVALEFGAGECPVDALGEAFSGLKRQASPSLPVSGSRARVVIKLPILPPQPFFGYQHIVETETAQPCCKRNMAVGPVAKKYFGVELKAPVKAGKE